MSLQTALNRAKYRWLRLQADFAQAHWVRSGKHAYLYRMVALCEEAAALKPACNFR